MGEKTKFDELRIDLFNEVIMWKDSESMTDEFKRKFLKLLELCTFSMMEEADNFFALFTMQMKREIKLDLPTAVGNTASISHFTIYFNPYIFLQCSLEEMKALLKHEVYHIMYNHLKRAEIIKGKYSSTAINTAMDISINQYIHNMPLWSDNIRNIMLTYNVDLLEDLPFEEYARIIQEGMNKLKSSKGPEILEGKDETKSDSIKKEHDVEHAHDLWESSQEQPTLQQIKQLTKKVSNIAAKGKIPTPFEKAMELFNAKAEISWKDHLRNTLGTLHTGYKKTSTRNDRRQPERLELRGKLPKYTAHVIVAIDISGSITDKEIDKIMIEVFDIVKIQNHEITVIECDNQIRRVYKAKSKKDIKSKLDTKGGTAFSPVIEYMNKLSMRNCFLIYFTDGVGEKKLNVAPINYKILWVLTGKDEKLSLDRSYGIIKKLPGVNVQKADPTYAKDTMKEILMEWAK
ncbi:peptidase [Clostridiaceae bacterium UIB06]|uniref:Peptidase n=1 Tax=Clostridium thailandense TaxID=2794346 RepID=A0A949TM92_9CLOT|nr:VWA-like domain-containing protein [Clostridium thailandense]MBV7271887.1 peptidase [Clostridium thailandense]MCH5137113.1 peptidase [Clostridiaceae bacterium UIB06]